MKSIIALIDGSVYAESVCDHAGWIASRTGASVELVHILGRRETGSTPQDLSGGISLGARTTLLEELSALDEQRAKLNQKRGRALLDAAKPVVEKAGATDVTTRLRVGDIVEAITTLEDETGLIVIGKRGEAADFATMHLGSNLERVVRAATHPVFVASRAFKPINSIMIAYDGGTSSMKAVDYVARSALFAGLPCHLLSVKHANRDLTRSQEDATAILTGAGYDVIADIVDGPREDAIARAVEDRGIGLLVMGAYGHSRIRNLIIGSTTTEMIRSCLVPIVLFR